MNGIERLSKVDAGTPVFLGLDLSKLSWHITVRACGETVLSLNCPAQFTSLIPILKAGAHCRIASVYEAGPFGYTLHDWLSTQGVKSMVCSPAHVPVQAGNHVKTDRRDSLKLATLLEAGLLRPIAVPTLKERTDRELVRQRERLSVARRSSMAQINAFLLTYGIQAPQRSSARWTKRYVDWLGRIQLPEPFQQATFDSLRRRYLESDQHLKDHTRVLKRLADTPAHAAGVALLSSIPGFGWLTALTFSVEVFDWSRFTTGEPFSAFLGLTPSEYSSGQRIRHGGITHAGNIRLRTLLIESCWITIRHDAALRVHYEALKKRRGAKRAIVAIARRMCHRILAMVRTGELYRLEKAA